MFQIVAIYCILVQYLEPTKDLILKRQCVLDLIQEVLLKEMFKQNFDILDIILEVVIATFKILPTSLIYR